MAKTYRFSNKEVIQVLKEVLAAMEVKNFNIFRIRAYQNAIGSIEALTSSVYDLWQHHRLGEIQGVGGNLEDHINELFTTGEVKEFKSIKRGLPEGMFALIGIRGIGAKRAFKLAHALNLGFKEEAIERLKEAAEAGKIRDMDGFGEKLESDILNAISEMKMTKNEKQRLLLIKAEEIADRLISYIKTLPETGTVIALGSLRRRSPTVGDLDIAAVNGNGENIINHFLKFPEIAEVVAQGDKKVSVILTNDVQVDLRVANEKIIGSMIQYFTGNKQHNVILRTYALSKGMSLSEYGIKYRDKLYEFDSEKKFYDFIGVPYIQPELRQGKNEIELALKGKLPNLINLEDIRGDLHTHTIASDGSNTLAEMVSAAKSMGYEYLGITDHAPSIQSRGYEEVKSIIEKQRKIIDAMNESQKDIRILFGYEVNILADATLGLPDELMRDLDFVIASVHTAFNQDRDVMTDRIVKALENPYVNILGHPTGRLINERGPIDADWEKIFRTAADNDKIIEINGQPNRMDLPDDLVRDAINQKVKLMVDTDAHDVYSLGFMKYGVDVARRGFSEAKNVVNTLPINEFLRILSK